MERWYPVNRFNHTSWVVVVPVGFVFPPTFWSSVLLYLRSPKGSCCSISDNLSCSSYSKWPSFDLTGTYHLIGLALCTERQIITKKHFNFGLGINGTIFVFLLHCTDAKYSYHCHILKQIASFKSSESLWQLFTLYMMYITFIHIDVQDTYISKPCFTH